MKGLTDKPSYIIELLECGVTLEDVIDEHICEQALVRLSCLSFLFTQQRPSKAKSVTPRSNARFHGSRWRRARLWWATSVP